MRYYLDNRLVASSLLVSILIHTGILFLLLNADIKREIRRETLFARIVSSKDVLNKPYPYVGGGTLNNKLKDKVRSDEGNRDSGLGINGVAKSLPSLEDSFLSNMNNTKEEGKNLYSDIRFPDSPIKRISPPNSEMSRLFDPDVLKKSARDRAGDTLQDKASDITFDVKEFKYYGYLRRLKEKIESIWIYPGNAAERGIFGDLYIRFTIRKDGRLGNVELVRTSGYRELDDAAMKALRDGDPYWPLPDEWGEDQFTITGHFIYTLYGYYVR